jgi:predicted branched-subunit amino acid permease
VLDEPVALRDRREILRDSLAVAVSVVPYALSFGALSSQAGLSLAQTGVLSAFGFTGASQFAFVSSLHAGGTAAGAIALAWLLGARNGLYAVRMTQLMRWRGRRRVLGAHLTIDETTTMALGRDDPTHARAAFWTTGVLLWVLWNSSTLLGAWAGSEITDPQAWGLDAVIPAAFLALLLPQLRSRRPIVAASAAAAVTLAVAPVTPLGVPVFVAVLIAVPLALAATR